MARLPYPEPLDDHVSERMARNRRRDTAPEVRRGLNAAGLRFRVDHPVRVHELLVRPDIVFTRWRLAVFIDGCFWHGCPEHGNIPNRNRGYWVPKLQRNAARDARVNDVLASAGWVVLRFWEHEPPSEAVPKVQSVLDRLRRSAVARP